MKNNKWFTLEVIRKIYPLTTIEFINACGKRKNWFGVFVGTACSFHEKNTELIFNETEYKSAGKNLFNKILKNPNFFIEINKKIEKKSEKNFKINKKISKINLKKKNNKELIELFKEYYSAYKNVHELGSLQCLIDFSPNELLSEYIKKILNEKYSEKKLKINSIQAFVLLASPEKKSTIIQEQEAFIKLIKEIIKNEKLKNCFKEKNIKEKLIEFPEFNKKLLNHYKNFCWIPFMYEGPAWDLNYFIENIKKTIKQNPTEKKLNQLLEFDLKIKQKKKELIKKLELNEKEKKMFEIFMVQGDLKAKRKDSMYYSCFIGKKLFAEIAQRLKLSINQTRFFLPNELINALKGKKINVNELNERIKFSVYIIENGKEKFLIGKKAKKIYKKIFSEIKEIKLNELKGNCAFIGKTKGKVKLINHPNEMIKMNKKNIMISHSTNPNLVSAMKKASAIVTDVGGITCHAAIVSRELKIPCIIGTKIATKVFKDEELVEVNATKGIIKKVKK